MFAQISVTRSVSLVLTGLFLFTSAAGAQQPHRYEISAGYEQLFLGEGDVGAQAYRIDMARNLLSDRTGLALSLSYQRAVNKSLHSVVALAKSWKDKHTYVADLALFWDALRFEYGVTGHRLRLRAGPSVQRRYGENPRTLLFPAVFKPDPGRLEELRELAAQSDKINFYEEHLEEGDGIPQSGTYVMLSEDRRGTDVGGMVGASYGFSYQRFVAEAGIVWRVYHGKFVARGWVFSFGLAL